MTKIGIVTVTYNSAAVLSDFLDSLAAQSHKNFILYVIDNASKDDAIARVRERNDSRFIIIENRENLGVAAGNNQGISAALHDKCDAILLLNNDTMFPPELLTVLVDEVQKSGADMVTPKITYFNRPDLIWCAGGKFHPLAGIVRHNGELHPDDGSYDKPGWVSYAPTCCVLIKSSAFEKVGMMDEAYFVYLDDVDFMLRARKLGVSLYYTPRVTLRHKVSALTGGGLSAFTIRYETRNQIYFVRKHYPVTWPAWTSIHAVRFAVRAFLGKEPASLLGARYKALFEGLTMPLSVSGR